MVNQVVVQPEKVIRKCNIVLELTLEIRTQSLLKKIHKGIDWIAVTTILHDSLFKFVRLTVLKVDIIDLLIMESFFIRTVLICYLLAAAKSSLVARDQGSRTYMAQINLPFLVLDACFMWNDLLSKIS